MPTLLDVFVSLDGNNISGQIQSNQLQWQAETDDDAAMGDNTAKVIATRENWSFSANAKQDYSASGLDSVLYGIAKAQMAGTPVPLIMRPASGAVSATNPEYAGNVFLQGYDPISGPHGKLARTAINLVPAGDLTRATS